MVDPHDPRLSKWDIVKTVAGPVGPLDVVVTQPQGAQLQDTQSGSSIVQNRELDQGRSVRWVGVIGHPHPQMGGTLHNKVVQTLARCVREMGGVAVRFNYRGVEGSPGQFDEGVGEVQDYQAVLRWSVEQLQPQFVLLAGFSFGSFMAARVMAALEADGDDGVGYYGLALVAPPVENMPFSELPFFSSPVHVFQGELDDVVNPSAVYDWYETRAQNAPFSQESIQLTRLPGADHFFHGQLTALKKAVLGVFRDWVRDEDV